MRLSEVGATASRTPRRGAVHVHDDQRGLGLFEVIAGTLIATIAVLGLAYTFGVGRGLINRYEVARCAMGEAQHVVDSLSIVPPVNLVSGSQVLLVEGRPAGMTHWTVTPVDDPLDGLASSTPPDPNPVDYYRVTIEVDWGSGVMADRIQLKRVVSAP